MNVTPRLLVTSVQYNNDGLVNITVVPQLLSDDGTVVGSSSLRAISVLETAVSAFGVANGRGDGEWGNREIEQTLLAQTKAPQMPPPEGDAEPPTPTPLFDP